TLEELKILNTPVLNIFNKIDKAGKDNLSLLNKYKPSIAISALHKKGMDELLSEISKML
ncbi:MAG: hypothetical protein HQ564_06510, partial [Candidatus Saganbacteria bacterium]|nr:hypothetical protein [Candidatus Saganbacteria bacterium]